MPQLSPSFELAAIFDLAVAKPASEVTPDDLRVLIACYGWMDGGERARFAIGRDQLTQAESDNYMQLGLLDVYFPVKG